VLDWLRGGAAKSPAKRSDDDALFDEEFQRRLEVLAIVSRRLVAGRTRAERRSKKTGAGIEFAVGDDLVVRHRRDMALIEAVAGLFEEMIEAFALAPADGVVVPLANEHRRPGSPQAIKRGEATDLPA